MCADFTCQYICVPRSYTSISSWQRVQCLIYESLNLNPVHIQTGGERLEHDKESNFGPKQNPPAAILSSSFYNPYI